MKREFEDLRDGRALTGSRVETRAERERCNTQRVEPSRARGLKHHEARIP